MRRWIVIFVTAALVIGGLNHWNHTQAQDTPPPAPIIYTSDTSGSYGLYVVNQPQAILDSEANETDPALSPNGQLIVFASDFDGDFDLYLIQPDGTGGRALTTNDTPERQPRWISDNLVVYAAYVNDKWDLFQVDIDTGAISQLTNDSAAEVGPSFDGTTSSTTASTEPDATVSADRLNIRENPGTGAGIVTSVVQGDALTITGRLATNEWVQVVTPNGLVGWAYTSLLAINIDLNSVPVLDVGVIAPPTQPPAQPTQPPAAPTNQPQGTPSVSG